MIFQIEIRLYSAIDKFDSIVADFSRMPRCTISPDRNIISGGKLIFLGEIVVTVCFWWDNLCCLPKKVFIMCLNNNSFSFELKTPHELGVESFSGL